VYQVPTTLVGASRNTHCNEVQHAATHRNKLQRTTTHCDTLQHTAMHCNTLQLLDVYQLPTMNW